MISLIGIPLGLLYANATEWWIHKYLLHGRGRDRRSFFAYHWHDHHNAARRFAQHDPAYDQLTFSWNSQTKEIVALIGGAALYVPLFHYAPYFIGTLWFSTVYYYVVHRWSHQNPAWGRRFLPWHVDHHLGPDQNANWCVSWPWFDWVMSTRKKYIGTALEKPQRGRREQTDGNRENNHVATE